MAILLPRARMPVAGLVVLANSVRQGAGRYWPTLAVSFGMGWQAESVVSLAAFTGLSAAFITLARRRSAGTGARQLLHVAIGAELLPAAAAVTSFALLGALAKWLTSALLS